MRGLRETLFLLILAVVVVAAAGEQLVRVAEAVALPLAGLLAAIVVARLVWFYTSRW